MYLSKSKCWYSNNCLHFLKRAVPINLTPQTEIIPVLNLGIYTLSQAILPGGGGLHKNIANVNRAC
jgi:hypothetical protein